MWGGRAILSCSVCLDSSVELLLVAGLVLKSLCSGLHQSCVKLPKLKFLVLPISRMNTSPRELPIASMQYRTILDITFDDA